MRKQRVREFPRFGESELLFGIGVLPDGRRKKALTEMLDGVLELFGDRVLPFDIGAARCYAKLAVTARAAGKEFPTRPTDILPPLPPPGDLSSRQAIPARQSLPS
ncbi:hypothetical protein CN128_00940 [Sinorhizobium meliloti]|uniref:Uncharacterized protein n=1 Tax=Rhizobium meliloti (strain 1021) TaxID=266834 RepID=B3KLW2_RHIME|nr:hypothetical protein SMa5001 [Sinorhizobium meliloti 1021]AGG69738.1 Hypothetical protein SM2011_a5001 [Sinorhizobium meliloti 2011]ASP54191.1 hypothetical protein CDO31_22200 [Sinorhizobium meliloti]ASP60840.1 hypothetical protein CDO30_21585 [Sinorhizobium meliloti]ASP67524.1 hypothetical protein CDO29_24205 [Sinorhizobium meliloti]